MIDKLKLIEDRFKELSELLIQPDIISDQKKYIQISKEYKDKKKIIDINPADYNWEYKRFKKNPERSTNIYK